ncbi:hypothetical protein CYMTET_35262, partial [Cymbomonas tetramitiformis]
IGLAPVEALHTCVSLKVQYLLFRVDNETGAGWYLIVTPQSFVFVPIHDELHWSLGVICLNVLDGDGRFTAILHLDSMTHGHKTWGLLDGGCGMLVDEGLST